MVGKPSNSAVSREKSDLITALANGTYRDPHSSSKKLGYALAAALILGTTGGLYFYSNTPEGAYRLEQIKSTLAPFIPGMR
jgi:hypothetical protein